MKKGSLIGTWKLVSMELRSEDGRVHHPFGQDVAGHLIYSDDGYVAANILRFGPPSSAADPSLAIGEDELMFFEGCSSCCGKYEVQGNRVFHHAEGAQFSERLNEVQERSFELRGDRLTLSTSSLPTHGVRRTACLVWERV
jgi:hypothetical protein